MGGVTRTLTSGLSRAQDYTLVRGSLLVWGGHLCHIYVCKAMFKPTQYLLLYNQFISVTDLGDDKADSIVCLAALLCTQCI